MLREQIEKKRGMITSKRVLSEDEEKEISLSARGKIRGLQMTDRGIFVATQRSVPYLAVVALFSHPNMPNMHRVLVWGSTRYKIAGLAGLDLCTYILKILCGGGTRINVFI